LTTKIGFSTRNDNPLSKLIRWLTGSKCSHTWLLVDDPSGQMVLQAEQTFVATPWEQFNSGGNIIVALVDSAVPLDKGIADAKTWLGEKYDVEGLIGMFLVLVGRWFRVKLRNPLQNSKQLFCSEAVAKVLKESGYPGTENMDPSSTSPQDLYDLVVR